MKATFRKVYYDPLVVRTRRSRIRIVIKDKYDIDLPPEKMFNSKQLSRIHNAIHYTHEMMKKGDSN